MMVMTLSEDKQKKLIPELKRSMKGSRKDELRTQRVDDLFLFELETFYNSKSRKDLLELKRWYQGVLKTLPTERKPHFSN